MTNTIWSNPFSDDWSNASDWSAGLPTVATDAILNAGGAYTVAISSAAVAHSLTMDAAGATLSEDSGGSLTLKGRLTLDAGTVILDGENTFTGQTRLIGGTLEIGNALALGSSGLTMDGGVLIGTANTSFSNEIDANGTSILAAAHGDVFKFNGQAVFNMNSGGTIEFGQAGDDGTLVWDPLTLGVANSGAGFNVAINAGTLHDGNGSLSEVVGVALSTTIASGATLDIHGNLDTISNLDGAGAIISRIPGGFLTIDQGDFEGSIEGALALAVAGSLTLSGLDTYNGGTTIGNGADLSLYGKGSIGGNITDDGVLNIDRPGSAPLVLNGTISGSGAIQLVDGKTVLNGANSYSGGTSISHGILKVGNTSALGTGEATLSNSELMGTITESFSNQLVINGPETFIAARGTTLTLNTDSAWMINNAAPIVFGNFRGDGTIIWDSPSGSATDSFGHSLTIAGGTLRAGDNNFQTLLNSVHYYRPGFLDIKHGATLDVAGFATTLYNLRGSGTIENSGTSATVTISNGGFFGNFSGQIALDIDLTGSFCTKRIVRNCLGKGVLSCRRNGLARNRLLRCYGRLRLPHRKERRLASRAGKQGYRIGVTETNCSTAKFYPPA